MNEENIKLNIKLRGKRLRTCSWWRKGDNTNAFFWSRLRGSR